MVNQTPRAGRKHSEPQILLAARAAGREFQQICPPSAIHCSVFRATNHTTVLGDQTVWVCWCQLVAGPPVDLLPAGWSVHQLYPTREKIWREKSRWLRRGKKKTSASIGVIPILVAKFITRLIHLCSTKSSEAKRLWQEKGRGGYKREGKEGNLVQQHWPFAYSPGLELNPLPCSIGVSKTQRTRLRPENANASFLNMKYLGSWQAMVSVKRCCAKDRPMIWGTCGVNIHFVRVLAHDSVPVFSAAKWRDQMLICLLNGWVSNKLHLFILKAWLASWRRKSTFQMLSTKPGFSAM